MRRVIALAALLLAAVASARAAELPTATPEEVGLSSERLGAITARLTADVAQGTIPGGILLIAREGKICYFETVGALDPQTKAPMSKVDRLPQRPVGAPAGPQRAPLSDVVCCSK